ncbi:hypothetical protein [Azospirillum sp. sgz302134]
MKAFRFLLAGCAVMALLSACSSEQVASSFRSWCKGASNCTDNSRQAP